MKILYFGDPMGAGEETFEQEAEEIKRYLKEFIFGNKKFDFEATVDSTKPNESLYDILIFDFGGIGLGCMGLVESLSRMILKLIEDKPNTLFIAWTFFTNEYLKNECEKELGDYSNLIVRDMNNEFVIKQIKEWIDK
jgi:hypothetical protein